MAGSKEADDERVGGLPWRRNEQFLELARIFAGPRGCKWRPAERGESRVAKYSMASRMQVKGPVARRFGPRLTV
jgi:hypothetical protein